MVGLYMSPPDKAIVICVDEKNGIQALDRSQTILPLRPDVPASRSYDYKRNGRIDLFAALNILDGTVITEFHKRHRHQEFLIFLRTIDECVPNDLDIHMVMDNLGTHTQPDVKRWFARHPRFKLHFTPKGASWNEHGRGVAEQPHEEADPAELLQERQRHHQSGEGVR